MNVEHMLRQIAIPKGASPSHTKARRPIIMSPTKSTPFALTFLLALLLAMTLSSCSRFGDRSLKLPPNPILSGGLGWAVVKDAYVRLKESPSDRSRDLDHLRRGGVFHLEERELGDVETDSRNQSSRPGVQGADERPIWYGIASEGTKGWVKESELDIYSSEAQAEKAAESYR
jgi:hypothetical protein